MGRRCLCLQPQLGVLMQNGIVIRRNRKRNSDIWQFCWWEKASDGKRTYRRRQIGTVDQIPDIETARKEASLFVPDLNARIAKSKSVSMTNTWRSYSTKNIYKVYLKRWIIPKWSEYLLSDIRTIEVESWLRGLPLVRSTCAKIHNVMSCCSITLVGSSSLMEIQLNSSVKSAKRRSPPVVLDPGEIRTLLEGLKIRERTLVFIAASTGIRQSELFALKWGDINFSAGTTNVARSIVHGFVGPRKTETSQKPVPLHPLVAEALIKWRSQSSYRQPEDWVFASRYSHGLQPYWGQAILHNHLRPIARELGIETQFGWHTFRHTYSTLLRSVGTEFKVMQELLRHSTIRSTLDVYTQAITTAKQNAQAAVMSLVFSSQRRRERYKRMSRSVDFGCKLGAKCTQFAPNSIDFASPNHPVSHLECLAGTTGLEPATSAVTESSRLIQI